jgi:hypothetical protein
MRFLAGSVLALALFAPRFAAAQQPPAAPTTIPIGDWTLAPTMEVRIRGEYRRDAPDLGGTTLLGVSTPRIRDQWDVMERSRLGVGAERGALRAQITLQDARALGSPSPSNVFGPSRGLGELSPYEAFGEVRSSGTRPTFLRLGRQAIQWGEGRLIGTADFGPAGRSLDAARAHISLGQFDFEALAAILEVPHPLGASFGDTNGSNTSGVQLYGATGKWTIHPLLRVELFALARVARSAGDELDGSRFALARAIGERYTGSVRVSGEGSGWSYGAEGAYQLGSADSLRIGGDDIAAWAAEGHVQKTLDQLLLTPTIRVMASYASGDDGKGTKYKQFDPILADPQRFHGQMDLFSWSNQIDVGGRVQIVPWTDTILSAEYRYARLAQSQGEWIGGYLTAVGGQGTPSGGITVVSPATPSSSSKSVDLGHELDLGFAWRPWIPLELRAGWSGLLLGDGAKAVMSDHNRGDHLANGAISPPNIAQYAYLQATMSIP